METQELIDKIAKKEDVKSYLVKILEAFQQMDYHRLSDLLDEDTLYEDMKKTSFIYKQMNIFSDFKKRGDLYLKLSTNICTGCLCSEPVFVFTGNHSGSKYAIYVKFINDEIVDIYRCYEQSKGLRIELPF